jgi:hypothetical protein
MPIISNVKCILSFGEGQVIYAYQHHVRLLSPEPEVVKQPQFTRDKEPTLLCNQVPTGIPHVPVVDYTSKCSESGTYLRTLPITREIHEGRIERPDGGAAEESHCALDIVAQYLQCASDTCLTGCA